MWEDCARVLEPSTFDDRRMLKLLFCKLFIVNKDQMFLSLLWLQSSRS